MVTKELLQSFVDRHASKIGEVVSGGIKDKSGKWLLICPMIERFNLDFSKVKQDKEEVKVIEATETVVEQVAEIAEKPKTKKRKTSKKKK